MHLLSTNGPIDVLVCPEGDSEHSSSTASSSMASTPVKMASPHTPQEISLGSMAPPHDSDLDGLFQPGSHSINSSHLSGDCGFIPADVFESLSPPLNGDDFYSSLSPTEGILELFDLA